MTSGAAPMAGSYFDMSIHNDHDAYFAKYYPNGDFNKHNVVMGSDTMAGTYYDTNIVDDHDAYFAKYYPDENFNKNDIFIHDKHPSPTPTPAEPVDHDEDPPSPAPVADDDISNEDIANNILFGDAPAAPATHDDEEDISFSDSDDDTTDMTSTMMSSGMMSSEMMSAPADEHAEPLDYDAYFEKYYPMKSDDPYENPDEYFAKYYPEEFAYGAQDDEEDGEDDMMASDMMASDMMTSDMMTSDMMTTGDEEAAPSHHSHDFDFSGFDKTVRTQPSLRSSPSLRT